jgi:raffinose/stachyose/melibiose transport system substrate-binding protein
MADAYMAAHPNVTINITILENEAFKSKLTTVMQSGEPPDLFQCWGGGVMNTYAEAGLLRDITPEIEGEWGDSFGAGALAVYAYNGHQYGVPWDMGMVGFWYNKDLFAEAGIDAPPETWEEFLADVQLLKDAGITPIAWVRARSGPATSTGYTWQPASAASQRSLLLLTVMVHSPIRHTFRPVKSCSA